MVRNIITSSSEKREMNKQKAKHHFQELWFTNIIKKKATSEHHTVGIYGEIGNNKNFSKAQILIIWSKLLKIYLQWSKIDQFGDDLTRLLHWNWRETTQFLKFLLISINFRKLPDISEDKRMFFWIFFNHQTP